MADDNQEQNREKSDEENLHMENEIKKLKLSAQYGANFFEGEKDLSPEMENEWLNNIEEFENKFENADQITVAERLGNPTFPSADDLTDEQIKKKLDEVMKLMAENDAWLDVICEEPSEKIYRFIIEELFEHEMDDIQIEGMTTNFIYEEFHPNDSLDIEQCTTDFIREMLSDDFRDYLKLHLADECKTTDGKIITQEQANQKALHFGDAFDSFENVTVSNFQLDINGEADHASIQFDVSYRAYSGNDSQLYKGRATASLRRGELGYWNIASLTMPGFCI